MKENGAYNDHRTSSLRVCDETTALQQSNGHEQPINGRLSLLNLVFFFNMC
jgi:hypothetical protein